MNGELIIRIYQKHLAEDIKKKDYLKIQKL